MLDRKSHWDQIYVTKSPTEVSWYQDEPEISLQLIQKCALARSDPIIDIGGGTSVLVDHLLESGFEDLTVLDISPLSLQLTQGRLGTRAAPVHWLVGDITTITLPRTYALWHDRALFHFLTDPQERERYALAVQEALRPGGYLVLSTFALGGPLQCSGQDIVQYDASGIMAALGDRFILLEEGQERHITPAKAEQLFAYFRLQKVPRV